MLLDTAITAWLVDYVGHAGGCGFRNGFRAQRGGPSQA